MKIKSQTYERVEDLFNKKYFAIVNTIFHLSPEEAIKEYANNLGKQEQITLIRGIGQKIAKFPYTKQDKEKACGKISTSIKKLYKERAEERRIIKELETDLDNYLTKHNPGIKQLQKYGQTVRIDQYYKNPTKIRNKIAEAIKKIRNSKQQSLEQCVA